MEYDAFAEHTCSDFGMDKEKVLLLKLFKIMVDDFSFTFSILVIQLLLAMV